MPHLPARNGAAPHEAAHGLWPHYVHCVRTWLTAATPPNEKAAQRFWDEANGLSAQIDARRFPFLQSLRQQGAIQRTIDELTLEEKTILKLRYGVLQDDELTLRDIGEILGLSRERVRQIESRAEAKCRRSVRRAER